MNRRDMVMSLGAFGGMAAVNVNNLLQSGIRDSGQTPLQIMKQICLRGAKEQEFLARLGRQCTSSQPWTEKAARRKMRTTEAIAIQEVDQYGNEVAVGLRFVCDARFINCFAVEGQPFHVTRFCYSTESVCWRPGIGYPVYSSYCPRYEYSIETCYGAKVHQIIPLALNQGYFSGCQATDVCQGERAQLAFDVNDDNYADNSGTYSINIWSWS